MVLAPEGVPTISVSYFTLLAPLLFWIGTALLMWRLASRALARGRRLARRRRRARSPRARPAWSPPRCRGSGGRSSRGLVLMALTASFALSVAHLQHDVRRAGARRRAAYERRRRRRHDRGGSGLPAGPADAVRGLPGVAAGQPMQHRFAYVGNDLQDLYGDRRRRRSVRRRRCRTRSSPGGNAAADARRRWPPQPDGVLVSDETVHDFQLQPGDTVRLRLQFASDHALPRRSVPLRRDRAGVPDGAARLVPRRERGVRRAGTGSAAPQTLLVRTSGSPPAVAASRAKRAGAGVGRDGAATSCRSRRSPCPGSTAIDLAGLTKLELAFALMMAAGASGLVLALGLVGATADVRDRVRARRPAATARLVRVERGRVRRGRRPRAGRDRRLGDRARDRARSSPACSTRRRSTSPSPWAYFAGLLVAVGLAVAIAGIGMLRSTRRPAMTILRDL